MRYINRHFTYLLTYLLTCLSRYNEPPSRHRHGITDTVAHLSTNRARRRLTSLIEANALATTPGKLMNMSWTAMKKRSCRRPMLIEELNVKKNY